MKAKPLFISILLCCALVLGSCSNDDQNDKTDDDGGAPMDDDATPGDIDNYGDDDDALDDDDETPSLDDLIERLDFLQYMDIEPIREVPSHNGYTKYYFDKEDIKSFNGRQVHVAVSPGTSNNLMIFLEGGGAAWPDGGFCFQVDSVFNIGIKTRDAANPVRDWNFVYVPYRDCSLHCGDNEVEYNGKMRYHHGLRHLAAAVALAKKMFPNPDKVLVAGSSAGGYGTLYGWLVVKSQYRDTDTYIFNDSGTGFWDPYDLATFEKIKAAWNLTIPEECTLCTDTSLTYIYDTYLRADPQVRIGMFTSYYDALITRVFIGMDPQVFRSELFTITDKLKQLHPDRFNRFFIAGTTHTSYELEWCDHWPGHDFFLEEGPDYQIDGTSLFAWLGQIVNEDPLWADLLE